MVTKAGVPSNKVIVGVTSYARVFQMVDPSCYGDMCLFTGKLSGASPGRCTGERGYISDAELQEIIVDKTHVQHNYIDKGSESNVLVCKCKFLPAFLAKI